VTGRALVVGGEAERLPLPDRSIDAIVTDPPYGLEFMGKEWDSPRMLGQNEDRGQSRRPRRPDGSTTNDAWRRTRAGGTHSRGYAANNPRFYQAWCEQWAAEALRVLKPGGWLLAFGGTRTWHRLTCGIEDAGFELRDEIASFGPLAWLYGQGFPKGKACLKPGWEPVVVARRSGPSVLQIDASRVGHASAEDLAASQAGRPQQSVNGAGRWPANVVLTHDPGCVPVGVRKVRAAGWREADLGKRSKGGLLNVTDDRRGPEHHYADSDGTETVEAWNCEPGCPVFLLDQQSGERPGFATQRDLKQADAFGGPVYGSGKMLQPGIRQGFNDQGGASRFFYTAKADADERVTINGQGHPTVKPLDLMRWLVRLVTPPGGLILDPFAGSGTTGEAAMLEGFRCLLLDKDPDCWRQQQVRAHPYVRRRKVTTTPIGPEQGSLL
jgi:site-specific DNA-methyltransferase (adenine-specific)